MFCKDNKRLKKENSKQKLILNVDDPPEHLKNQEG